LAIDGAALGVLKRKSSRTQAGPKLPVLPEVEEKVSQALHVGPAVNKQVLRADAIEFVPGAVVAEQPTPELPSVDERVSLAKASPVMPACEIMKEDVLEVSFSRDTSHGDVFEVAFSRDTSHGDEFEATSSRDTCHQDVVEDAILFDDTIPREDTDIALSLHTSHLEGSSSRGSSVTVAAAENGPDGEVAGAGPELASILRLRHALTEKRQFSFDDADFDGGTGGLGGATGCGFGAGTGEGDGADGYPEAETSPREEKTPSNQRLFARLSSKLKARSCCHGGG